MAAYFQQKYTATDLIVFIEVYTGCIRTVSEDGMVSVIKR